MTETGPGVLVVRHSLPSQRHPLSISILGPTVSRNQNPSGTARPVQQPSPSNLDDEERQDVAGKCPQDRDWAVQRYPPQKVASRSR